MALLRVLGQALPHPRTHRAAAATSGGDDSRCAGFIRERPLRTSWKRGSSFGLCLFSFCPLCLGETFTKLVQQQ